MRGLFAEPDLWASRLTVSSQRVGRGDERPYAAVCGLFLRLGRPLESAARNRAHGQGVHVADLPVLEAEQMTVGQFVVAEAREYDHGPDIRIDNEAPVRDFHAAGYARVAGVLWRAFPCAQATFEPVAWRAPRHLHAVVEEDVFVGIGSGDERRARIAR